MKITYKNKKIEKVCTIADEAERRYGPRMAEKIHQRIDEIDASDTVGRDGTIPYWKMSSFKRRSKGSICNGINTTLSFDFLQKEVMKFKL